jgi:hypothetical protein
VFIGLVFVIIALHMPINWGALVLSLLYVAVMVGVFVAVTKGYTLTVGQDTVIAHHIVNTTIPVRKIQSVGLVSAKARYAQNRTCLKFHLDDGSDYLYKEFTGALSVDKKSYMRVAQAKALIEQRIAGLDRLGPMPDPTATFVPPPPPPPLPGSRGNPAASGNGSPRL